MWRIKIPFFQIWVTNQPADFVDKMSTLPKALVNLLGHEVTVTPAEILRAAKTDMLLTVGTQGIRIITTEETENVGNS